MITRSVFILLSSDLMAGMRRRRKESSTNIAFLRNRPPGRADHTVLIQSRVGASSIQPFGRTRTWTPGGNFIHFGSVLRLKMTYGASFPPSAVHANITVKWLFSCPVIRIDTVERPFWLSEPLYARTASQTSVASGRHCPAGPARSHAPSAASGRIAGSWATWHCSCRAGVGTESCGDERTDHSVPWSDVPSRMTPWTMQLTDPAWRAAVPGVVSLRQRCRFLVDADRQPTASASPPKWPLFNYVLVTHIFVICSNCVLVTNMQALVSMCQIARILLVQCSDFRIPNSG